MRDLCWEMESEELKSDDDSNTQWINCYVFLRLASDRGCLAPIDAQRIARCVEPKDFAKKTNSLKDHFTSSSISKESSLAMTSCSMTLINNSQPVWVQPLSCKTGYLKLKRVREQLSE